MSDKESRSVACGIEIKFGRLRNVQFSLNDAVLQVWDLYDIRKYMQQVCKIYPRLSVSAGWPCFTILLNDIETMGDHANAALSLNITYKYII